MKGKIAVMTAVIGCLLTPGIARSQVPGMEKMEAVMEWAMVGMICAWTAPLLGWGEALYEEGQIDATDCVKIAEAVKGLSEVLEKRAGKFKDATVRKESVAYAEAIIAQADAYVKYYEGDEKTKEDIEKYAEEAEAHLEAIGNYFEAEE